MSELYIPFLEIDGPDSEPSVLVNCLDTDINYNGQSLESVLRNNNSMDRPSVTYENEKVPNSFNNVLPKISGFDTVIDQLVNDDDILRFERIFILTSMKIVEVSKLYEDEDELITFCGVDKHSSYRNDSELFVKRINLYDYYESNIPY